MIFHLPRHLPGAFVEEFQKAASEGASAVVAIVLSGELSATIDAANQAADIVKGQLEVRVIDSRTVTMGLGSIVVRPHKSLKQVVTYDCIFQSKRSVGRTYVHAALDTLENLRKNGRIGAAQSL